MSSQFEISLDIANVTIESVKINRKGEYIITVTSTEQGTRCHRGGRQLRKCCGHGRAVMLRHLPILARKTYLRIFPTRYECPHCKGKKGKPVTSTQRVSWYEPRSGQTKAYEQQVLLGLINSTVQDVSLKEDLSYEAVMGIIDRHVQSQVNWKKLKQLEVLGLDEIALKKGHRDSVTIVTALIACLGFVPMRT